jgi:hypothetical protein
MKKLFLNIFLVLMFLALTACSNFDLLLPEVVTIDGIQYRNGFYGDLLPVNLIFENESYEVGFNIFHRVECDQFDWVHSERGKIIENGVRYGGGELYCAENQWEQARSYYANNNNFKYYYIIGGIYSDNSTEIKDIDYYKFDMLMLFINEHKYEPFNQNKDVKTRRLPIPEEKFFPEIGFYRESNDGYFSSFKSNRFRVVDGNLLFVYQYDYGYGEYEEMVACDVPNDLGQYFIELLSK